MHPANPPRIPPLKGFTSAGAAATAATGAVTAAESTSPIPFPAKIAFAILPIAKFTKTEEIPIQLAIE